jgi:hypothetical protein
MSANDEASVARSMGLVTDRPEWKPLLAELEAKGVPRTVADVLSIGLIVRRCNQYSGGKS